MRIHRVSAQNVLTNTVEERRLTWRLKYHLEKSENEKKIGSVPTFFSIFFQLNKNERQPLVHVRYTYFSTKGNDMVTNLSDDVWLLGNWCGVVECNLNFFVQKFYLAYL